MCLAMRRYVRRIGGNRSTWRVKVASDLPFPPPPSSSFPRPDVSNLNVWERDNVNSVVIVSVSRGTWLPCWRDTAAGRTTLRLALPPQPLPPLPTYFLRTTFSPPPFSWCSFAVFWNCFVEFEMRLGWMSIENCEKNIYERFLWACDIFASLYRLDIHRI